MVPKFYLDWSYLLLLIAIAALRDRRSLPLCRGKIYSSALYIARAVGSDNKRAAVDEFRLQLQI